jgi:hypothetical protein
MPDVRSHLISLSLSAYECYRKLRSVKGLLKNRILNATTSSGNGRTVGMGFPVFSAAVHSKELKRSKVLSLSIPFSGTSNVYVPL